jgi:hypothetical protein
MIDPLTSTENLEFLKRSLLSHLGHVSVLIMKLNLANPPYRLNYEYKKIQNTLADIDIILIKRKNESN